MAGDEVFPGINVSAIVTGVQEGGRGHPEMDLPGPRFPQQADNSTAGGSPDNGVIHQHHPLSGHAVLDSAEFDFHLIQPVILARSDKGTADILVLDEADTVGNARRMAVAQRGIQPGVGHPHHHVRLDRVGLGQYLPGPQTGGVDGHPANDRVGPGKVDVLKDAGGGLRFSAVLPAGYDAILGKHQNLSWLQVTDKFRPYSGQSAALGGGHITPVLHFSIAQRAKAVGVPGADQLLRGHEHQRVGPLQSVHGRTERSLNRGGAQPLPGDDVGDDLGIAGTMEDSSRQLQLVSKLGCIAQISVVRQGHMSFLVIDLDGLAVAPVGGPGCAVAGMAHRHSPLGQPVQRLAGKDLPHQPQVLAGGEYPVVVDHNAAALLSTVLEGIQAVISQTAHVRRPGSNHSKDTAFLMDTHFYTSVLSQINSARQM